MINASPSKPSSAARRNRKLASAIEGLEPRAYLTGVAFGSPQTAATGVSPVYVDLENIYGTSHADLIVANSNNGSNNSVSILQGTGTGTFQAVAPTIPLDFAPLTIRAGVLQGGGLVDIVVGSSNSDLVGVITQNSSHQFTEQDLPQATGLANTRSVAIGDFNNDGVPDIAVASLDSGTSNNVAIFLNGVNGNPVGTFTLSQTLSVPHTQVASITSYAAAAGGTNLAVANASSNTVTILNNDGAGNFTVGNDYSVGSEPVTIVDGQFDTLSNNNDDLVTANEGDGTVSTLLQQPNGTFSSAISTTVNGAVPGGGPLKVRAAKLNSDNYPDLICLLGSGGSGDAEVLLGNGNGTFRVGNVINAGNGPYTGIAAGDLDGDLLTDMVLSSQSAVTSLLNTTSSDTAAPTATISANQPSVATGAATVDFTVTYTDAQQVDTSTLGNNNLTVTTPSGGSETATLVSTNLTPAASVTVTYSIPAQGGLASQTDNGTYTVNVGSTPVQNAGGVPVAGGIVGQFTVNVLNPNGPNLVAGAVTVNNPASVVAGARFAGATRVTVVNSGNQTAKGKIVIDLYASPTQTIASGTPVQEAVTRNVNLKPGAKVVEVLPGFKWPTTPGTDFIVVDVDATQTLAETNFADNFGISAKSTIVAAPFVDIENIWSGKLPATLKVGRRTPLAVALMNLGNVTARATASYTVQAEDAGGALTTIGNSTVRIVVAASHRTAVSIPVTVPTTLASGTYHIVITISYPGDTNAGDDSATSATTFTV